MIDMLNDTKTNDFVAKVIKLIELGQRDEAIEMICTVEDIQSSTIALRALVAYVIAILKRVSARDIDHVSANVRALASALDFDQASALDCALASASTLAKASSSALTFALASMNDLDLALALASARELALASEFVYVIIRVLNPNEPDIELQAAIKRHL